MKTRNHKSLGALHPVLFFSGIYFVALLFSIFICSAIFYSCNSNSGGSFAGKTKQAKPPVQVEKTIEVMAIANR
jgi:hypothetical protein